MNSLADIRQSTKVTFPQGATRGVSAVRYVAPFGTNRSLVIVDETPFHPLSNSWPDQETDRGSVTIESKVYEVVDSLSAAINPQEPTQLFIDTDIPSKRETEGWHYLVAHIVDMPPDDTLVGQKVELQVDEDRRKRLSIAHTSGHLAAYAMSKATADLWRKEVKLDGLGNPDLDQLAMEYSRMTPTGDMDKYRVGKSLRKKGGFDSETFFARSGELADQVNEQVSAWLATKTPVVIETDGDTLEAQRYCLYVLDSKEVKLPCGGTHPKSLAEIASIRVRYEFFPDIQEFTMYTQFEVA